MPSANDIASGIYGAWRLALRDPGALAYFDRTPAGFWKSFFAALIVLPAYALVVSLGLEPEEMEAGIFRIAAAHLVAYVIGWSAFPLVVDQICNVMDKRAKFIGFIVAYNWAQVLQMALYLPVAVLTAAEVLPQGATALLNMSAYMLILTYQWYVARTVLEVRPLFAVGVVAVDLALSILLNIIAREMLF